MLSGVPRPSWEGLPQDGRELVPPPAHSGYMNHPSLGLRAGTGLDPSLWQQVQFAKPQVRPVMPNRRDRGM